MTVGSCKIELRIPGSDSLKAKRRVVKSLKERAQNKRASGHFDILGKMV